MCYQVFFLTLFFISEFLLFALKLTWLHTSVGIAMCSWDLRDENKN